jgi:hypothetical protein
MHPRIPEPVQPVLHEYLLLMEKKLPGLLAGFYLHGSLALGAFNLHSSDIDFIAVVSRRSTAADVEELRGLHAELARKHPRWPLQGSYLLGEDLGQFDGAMSPGPHLTDGVLTADGCRDGDSVTWWLLKHRGIALMGPEPQALTFTVDWEHLIARMHQNLNTYWKHFTCRPARMAWLLTDFGIQWAVLGVLRLYYTFQEQDITSKTGAGEYGLAHLPERWHRIIREAIHIREHTGASTYRSHLLRAVDAWAFLNTVIRLGNALRE